MFIYHKKYIVCPSNRSAFGLIEVMISAMILSISLLGIASIQSKALNIMIEASRQETAYRMIGQLSNFALTMDPTLVNNMVADSASQQPNIAACYAAPSTNCTQPIFYQTLVLEWNKMLDQILPHGKGCTCVSDSTANATTIRVAINWTALSGSSSVVYFDNQILSATIGSAGTYKACPGVTPMVGLPQTICDFT